MPFADFHWFSPTLGKQVGSYVLLPDGGKPPFATFYLLHGMSDDYTIWLRRTNIERYLGDLPLMIVMPDGFRGFYTNANEGAAYATYMARDLINAIERNFPAKPTRSARCIGGLSMGGYGALRLALGYPDLFASANSHSGAVLAGTQKWEKHDRLDPTEFRRVFGRTPAGSEHDLLMLAKRCKTVGRMPKLRIDCGTEDFLLQDNRGFDRKLTAMGIGHEYDEYPGAHNWDYWDLHIRTALEFHARNLRLKRGAQA